jgi:hypothetical protein
MPWYYFSLENGDCVAAPEGEQFADDRAAAQHAKQIARDFARNDTAPGRLRIKVRNEAGDEIAEAPLQASSN